MIEKNTISFIKSAYLMPKKVKCEGVDIIKITTKDGVWSNTVIGVGQQLTDGEMQMIEEIANCLGRKVVSIVWKCV